MSYQRQKGQSDSCLLYGPGQPTFLQIDEQDITSQQWQGETFLTRAHLPQDQRQRLKEDLRELDKEAERITRITGLRSIGQAVQTLETTAVDQKYCERQLMVAFHNISRIGRFFSKINPVQGYTIQFQWQPDTSPRWPSRCPVDLLNSIACLLACVIQGTHSNKLRLPYFQAQIGYAYFDDVLVMSRSLDEHLQELHQVSPRLLLIRPDKYEFRKKEATCLLSS